MRLPISHSHIHCTLLNQEIRCFLNIVLLLVNSIECWVFSSLELGSYLTTTTHNLKITYIHSSHIETIPNIPSSTSTRFCSLHCLIIRIYMAMDIVLSVLASEIVSRSISLVIAKYHKQSSMDKLARLEQVLLRAHTIVEESDGNASTYPTRK